MNTGDVLMHCDGLMLARVKSITPAQVNNGLIIHPQHANQLIRPATVCDLQRFILQ